MAETAQRRQIAFITVQKDQLLAAAGTCFARGYCRAEQTADFYIIGPQNAKLRCAIYAVFPRILESP